MPKAVGISGQHRVERKQPSKNELLLEISKRRLSPRQLEKVKTQARLALQRRKTLTRELVEKEPPQQPPHPDARKAKEEQGKGPEPGRGQLSAGSRARQNKKWWLDLGNCKNICPNIQYLARAMPVVLMKEVSFLFHLVDMTGRRLPIFKSLLVLFLHKTGIYPS